MEINVLLVSEAYKKVSLCFSSIVIYAILFASTSFSWTLSVICHVIYVQIKEYALLLHCTRIAKFGEQWNEGVGQRVGYLK
jgi:hypothetical protein